MKVVVLLSTWQGERFVLEQLRSILQQLPESGSVIVRDDGSTDATVAHIESLGDPRIRVIRGENIGFARSFFHLLHAAPDDADFVMLSDQDDVWLPTKISRAADHLARFDGRPALYFSRLRLVDEALQPIGESPPWPQGPSMRSALVQNIAAGCTMAINRPGLALARAHGDLSMVHFHDWWLYLVFCALGDVVADPEPTILYRQHAGNVIGTGPNIGRHLATLRFIRKTNWLDVMYRQVANFLATHGARLDAQDRRFIESHFGRGAGAMLRLTFAPVRMRQTIVDETLFRFLLIASLPRSSRRGRAGP
jgi:glycosyltransferase involved in cell wall biosynthesis